VLIEAGHASREAAGAGRYSHVILERVTVAIATGWHPDSGMVLPFSPRLAPGQPTSVWHVLHGAGVAEQDMVAVLAALCERHGVTRARFYNATIRQRAAGGLQHAGRPWLPPTPRRQPAVR